MKLLRTEEAAGKILCHDITQIIKGVTKDAVFRKGHIIKKEDIPLLLSLGKDHIYIWENDETVIHENDAAEILRDICMGANIKATAPKEGKIELISEIDGMLKINKEKLKAINSLGEMMIATRHSGFSVKKGEKLAGTRIIPLIIKKDKMNEAKIEAGETPLLEVLPFKTKKIGVITTGNEIFHKRIEDQFTPVIASKFKDFNSEITEHIILDDKHEKITEAIDKMIEDGIDIVVCTGGMSVDPDDSTPLAIKNTGARVVTYGAPVLPGAMFMLAYTTNNRPIIGLPGCVMYAKRTIFDLVLPSLITDQEISKAQLADFGHGGLCLNCEKCVFPNCSFGK
ncbi:MAG: molybdopterin-binding protein [Spirochaetales bacterium]|nr:molybdopterin-binding protein [Spirochaetales bacterium]